MIPRYSRPEMTRIWQAENQLRIWFEIERLAAEAMGRLGLVPKSTATAMTRAAKKSMARIVDAERIAAIERETRHDVIAFLTNLAEVVGPPARFVHQGLTSSDVLDTALAVQLTQATDLLLADLDRLLAALRRRALEHKMTVCVGRTHGMAGLREMVQVKYVSRDTSRRPLVWWFPYGDAFRRLMVIQARAFHARSLLRRLLAQAAILRFGRFWKRANLPGVLLNLDKLF